MSKLKDQMLETTTLKGVITPFGQIRADLEDSELQIKVGITESGPRGKQGPPGPPGTTNYLELYNLPSIESVELKGDKSLKDFGVNSIIKKHIDTLF